jgi:hypothetical protein
MGELAARARRPSPNDRVCTKRPQTGGRRIMIGLDVDRPWPCPCQVSRSFLLRWSRRQSKSLDLISISPGAWTNRRHCGDSVNRFFCDYGHDRRRSCRSNYHHRGLLAGACSSPRLLGSAVLLSSLASSPGDGLPSPLGSPSFLFQPNVMMGCITYACVVLIWTVWQAACGIASPACGQGMQQSLKSGRVDVL